MESQHGRAGPEAATSTEYNMTTQDEEQTEWWQRQRLENEYHRQVEEAEAAYYADLQSEIEITEAEEEYARAQQQQAEGRTQPDDEDDETDSLGWPH